MRDLMESVEPDAITEGHQRLVVFNKKRKYPQRWPHWPMRCRNTASSTGNQCQIPAIRGGDRCHSHGCRGRLASMAHNKYLAWVMCGAVPEMASRMIQNEELALLMTTNVARYLIEREDGGATNQQMRMHAAIWMLDAGGCLTSVSTAQAEILTVLEDELEVSDGLLLPRLAQLITKRLDRAALIKRPVDCVTYR